MPPLFPWLLACALFNATLWAQSSAPSDVYAHFVGDWVGTDRYAEAGQLLTKPLTLHVTELPKQKGILLEYHFGDGAQVPFEHPVKKTIRLDLAQHQVVIHFRAFETAYYEAAGLNDFATQGLGTFAVRTTQLEHGSPVMYRGSYHLSQEEFSWMWERAEKGQTFTPYGDFQLHRAAPANSRPVTTP